MSRIIRRFNDERGNKVMIRTPEWSDLDGFMNFINSLVREHTYISANKIAKRVEEAEWLSRLLVSIEKGEAIDFVAEVKGRIVANGEVRRMRGLQSHVGVLAISVSKDYRDAGIGTALIRSLLKESRRMGLKIVLLDAFATNKRGIYFYSKLGFREVGKVPKAIYRDGRYIDEVRMAIEL